MNPGTLTIRSNSALAVAMVQALLIERGIAPAAAIHAVHDSHLQTPGVRLEVDGGHWLYLGFEVTPAAIASALADGASGILTLENTPEEFEQALASIAEGGVGYLPVNVLRRLTGNDGFHTNGKTTELDGLTEREIEVLRRIGRGETNGDIASALGISYHTVRSHIRTVAIKLGTATRSELLAHARALSQRMNAV